MPIRDLPPSYPLDPNLREPSARFKDHAQEFLEQALYYCQHNASRDDPNDALSVGTDVVAVQLNVLARELESAAQRLAPTKIRGMTHAEWVERVVADAVHRALRMHLERHQEARVST